MCCTKLGPTKKIITPELKDTVKKENEAEKPSPKVKKKEISNPYVAKTLQERKALLNMVGDKGLFASIVFWGSIGLIAAFAGYLYLVITQDILSFSRNLIDGHTIISKLLEMVINTGLLFLSMFGGFGVVGVLGGLMHLPANLTINEEIAKLNKQQITN